MRNPACPRKRGTWHPVLLLPAILALALTGCDSKTSPAATTQSTSIRIASLSPAATDLLIAMGAADHLQAVSNFDAAEINGRTLPRVGDYQTTDWETLASLHLQAMIIQMDPGRLSPAFADNAKAMGIKLIDVRLNTIADILSESQSLATAVGEPAKGEPTCPAHFAATECREKTVRIALPENPYASHPYPAIR